MHQLAGEKVVLFLRTFFSK